MDTLDLLLKAFPGPINKDCMADRLALSAADITSQIEQMRGLGLEIEPCGKGGYRLSQWPALMLPQLIHHYRRGKLGANIVWRESVDSTNLLAKELARQGAPHGTLVVAEEQKAGRGRRLRKWDSRKGEGIFASLILRPCFSVKAAPLLPLAAGVAVAEVIQNYGLKNTWLKWPNDVWIGQRKLAGILAELSAGHSIDFVVLGMGINTHQRQFPPPLGETATSLFQESGQAPQRALLLAQILEKVENLLPLLSLTDSRPLVEAWQKHDRLRGCRVRVIEPDGEYSGLALGLSPEGALRIGVGDGQEKLVWAGDVSIRPDF